MPHRTPAHPPIGGAHRLPLRQGQVPARPPRNSSQAHSGVNPVSSFGHGSQKFQPLPDPLIQPPYHFDLEAAVPGVTDSAAKLGKLVYYQAPIIAIPGNHDGDPADSTQTSLDGFVRYFIAGEPRVNPESHDEPRVTMSQPNVYFTLNAPFVTIVGMYTNVPEHGSIDSVQQQWLTNEFATAPHDKALILALHHPVYSFDDHHSGSPRMADAVQQAINDSRRVPNMVLSAHVHNYQRIEQQIVKGSPTPFMVIGNGGYFHLHGMNIGGVAPGPTNSHSEVKLGQQTAADAATGAKLIYSNHKNHGYATLTVDAHHITGFVNFVEEAKYPAEANADPFSYTSQPIVLPKGEVISL